MSMTQQNGFYMIYLSSLCRRRRWSDPHYETRYSYSQHKGYHCVVRVNNHDYMTESAEGTEMLAREAAAMRAYMFCRNISAPGMQALAQSQGNATDGGEYTYSSNHARRDSSSTYSQHSSRSSGDGSGVEAVPRTSHYGSAPASQPRGTRYMSASQGGYLVGSGQRAM